MQLERAPILISATPNGRILQLAGTLGVAEAEPLRQAAIELARAGEDVLVDWSAVEQVDCSIAQVLLSLRAGLAARGRALRATELPDPVKAYLQTAGLAGLLERAQAQ